MNANAFRHFYEYHFAKNRKIWDSYITRYPTNSSLNKITSSTFINTWGNDF